MQRRRTVSFYMAMFGLGLACQSGGRSSPGGGRADGAASSVPACSSDDPFRCEAMASAWATTLVARSYDGTGNNVTNPTWGAAGQALRRTTTVAYGDGISTPARASGPSARAVSMAVSFQTDDILNARGASDFLWQWGQFVDHDMTLSTLPVAVPHASQPNSYAPEPFPIPIPTGDPFFDPRATGTQTMPFSRSGFVPGSSPRQQLNMNTAFVDASMVYGSTAARAMLLRANDGTGRLLTSTGNLLPLMASLATSPANVANLPQVTNPNDADQGSLFVGGDERANEQVGLTAMHVVWMREHNRLAGLLNAQVPWLTDEQVYQFARAVVGAEIEHITYGAFLPMLIGPSAMPPYQGYQPGVDPRIENLFTICFRVGHTLLSPQIQMMGPTMHALASGPLSLADAFFRPDIIVEGAGVEPILRGLSIQKAEEVDPLVIGQVQNLLFGSPGAGGLDLVSFNIQRGRDHGLPSYNQARIDYGLPPASSFQDITSNTDFQQRLTRAYATVHDIDPWVGAVSEDHAAGAMVGPLLVAIVSDQFRRTRDGDRFWYETTLPAALVEWVKTQTLAMVIERNTAIGQELPSDVFTAAP